MPRLSNTLLASAASLRLATLGLATLGLLAAGHAVAGDAVEGMCLDLNRSEELCDCAAKKLRSEFGDQGYMLYEEVGAVYRQELAEDKLRTEAWDAGVQAAARTRGESPAAVVAETNSLARAHRKAMKACP